MKIATVLFRETLQSAFGPLDWVPLGDGEIHRFHVPGDKPGRLNGWYVLFIDSIAAGAFGSWKEGKTHTWCSRQPHDHQEAQQIREHIEQARRRRDAERLRCQYQAAELALCWWCKAPGANPEHAYLVAKQIDPYTLRQRNDELLVPLYANGQLVNLQRIGPDGSKRFLRGGKVQASYSILGTVTSDQPLCICEGWATAATLHQSGYTVAAAMNAGNLKPVALALKARYSNVPLIITGDDDRQTDGNPGRTFANAAAVAAGAQVTFPDWPANAPLDLTDYNDLVIWRRANGLA
ncbi:hypothetical protein PS3A_01900 [Pseudomonas sp. 3A(2025)]